MNTLKLNFTIPKDVDDKLRELVGKRQRSAFVAEAVREKLKEIEREKLERALTEAYIERREEDMELYREWEAVMLEG
ncbi:MAG: hypothetical protein ACE5JL_10455 [Dehalococcoidia bacterium]